MNLSKGNRVADLGDQPAVRQVMTTLPDGTRVLERVPSGDFIKVVKPSGAVCRVPIHNGRCSNEGNDDPYKSWIENSLWKTGSVPYHKCLQTLPYEVTTGYLPTKWYRGQHPIIPEHLRNRQPCRSAANGKPISKADACACVEELIEYRKKWQSERMENIEVKTAAMMQSEASKGLAGAVRDVAEVVRDLKNAGAGKSRKGRKVEADVDAEDVEIEE